MASYHIHIHIHRRFSRLKKRWCLRKARTRNQEPTCPLTQRQGNKASSVQTIWDRLLLSCFSCFFTPSTALHSMPNFFKYTTSFTQFNPPHSFNLHQPRSYLLFDQSIFLSRLILFVLVHDEDVKPTSMPILLSQPHTFACSLKGETN